MMDVGLGEIAASALDGLSDRMSDVQSLVGSYFGSDESSDSRSAVWEEAAQQQGLLGPEQLKSLSSEEIAKLIDLQAQGDLTGASPEAIAAAKNKYADAVANADVVDRLARLLGLPNDIDDAADDAERGLVVDSLHLPAEALESGLNAQELVKLNADLQLAGDVAEAARDPETYELIKEMGVEAGMQEVVKRRMAESLGVPADIAAKLTMEELDEGVANSQEYENYDAVQSAEYWKDVQERFSGHMTAEEFQKKWDTRERQEEESTASSEQPANDASEVSEAYEDSAASEVPEDNGPIPPFIETTTDPDASPTPFNPGALDDERADSDDSQGWIFSHNVFFPEENGWAIRDVYRNEASTLEKYVTTYTDAEGNYNPDEDVMIGYSDFDSDEGPAEDESGNSDSGNGDSGSGDSGTSDSGNSDSDNDNNSDDDQNDDGNNQDDTATTTPSDTEETEEDQTSDENQTDSTTPTPDSVDVDEQAREEFLNSPLGAEQMKQDQRGVEMALGGGLILTEAANEIAAIDFFFSELGSDTRAETERQIETKRSGGVTDPPEVDDASSSTTTSLIELMVSGQGHTDPPESSTPTVVPEEVNPKSPVGPTPIASGATSQAEAAEIEVQADLAAKVEAAAIVKK